MPRSTRSDDGIRCGNVRREHDGTNVVGNAEVGIHSEDVEVRVIEDVEHLAAKFRLTLSLNFHIFDSDMSQLTNLGPRKRFRPMLPCVVSAGGVITALPCW